MMRYLVAGVKHAFGLHRPGRKLPVQPSDILLAGYPQSGNAWLQSMLANLAGGDVSQSNIHRIVLDAELSTKRDFDRAARPRIIQSNSSFDPRYQGVVYLVRDPRDVAISRYRALRMQQGNEPTSIEKFMDRFLAGDLDPDFGSWGENVGSWLGARSGYAGFLCVRYEDLVSDTLRELTRIAAFVGRSMGKAELIRAIDRSSKALLAPANEREELPHSQLARIEAAWGDVMACAGYPLTTRDTQGAIDSSLIGLLATGAVR